MHNMRIEKKKLSRGDYHKVPFLEHTHDAFSLGLCPHIEIILYWNISKILLVKILVGERL